MHAGEVVCNVHVFVCALLFCLRWPPAVEGDPGGSEERGGGTGSARQGGEVVQVPNIWLIPRGYPWVDLRLWSDMPNHASRRLHYRSKVTVNRH